MNAGILRCQRCWIPPPRGGIMDSCEPPDVGARNQTWVLYKSSMDTQPMGHLLIELCPELCHTVF